SSAMRASTKSMPAVTPPPDRMLPSLTMRPSSTMAPKTGSNSRHAQWPPTPEAPEKGNHPPPCPVAGRTAAAEKARSAQNERPGAHRSQIARGCSGPGELFDKEVILGRSEAATAAWHQEHVARLDRSQVVQVRKGEAVRRNRFTSERSHPDMQVGCAREKLVRPCEVELGHAVVHRHHYADWL